MKMSLENLGNGAAVERFDDELARVIENIVDPNTEAKAKRSVTLVVTFAPDEDRERMDVTISCASKLRPAKIVKTWARVGVGPDGAMAVEDTTRQLPLFPQDDPKVTPISSAQGGAR